MASALVKIVDQLLQADPDKRQKNAQELVEQLVAYAYTSGKRFDSAELAAALAPLSPAARDAAEEIEPASVFDEPPAEDDKTPVEVPQTSSPPPPQQSAPESGERREVTILVVAFGDRESKRLADGVHMFGAEMLQ